MVYQGLLLLPIRPERRSLRLRVHELDRAGRTRRFPLPAPARRGLEDPIRPPDLRVDVRGAGGSRRSLRHHGLRPGSTAREGTPRALHVLRPQGTARRLARRPHQPLPSRGTRHFRRQAHDSSSAGSPRSSFRLKTSRRRAPHRRCKGLSPLRGRPDRGEVSAPLPHGTRGRSRPRPLVPVDGY